MRSSARTPAMVVPPGEVTMSLSWAGLQIATVQQLSRSSQGAVAQPQGQVPGKTRCNSPIGHGFRHQGHKGRAR